MGALARSEGDDTRGATCFGILVAVAGIPLAAADYQPPRGRFSTIEKVRDNLYFIRGGDPSARARARSEGDRHRPETSRYL